MDPELVPLLLLVLDELVEDVIPEASLVDDLGADSLALVELIMSMEEAFDIDIDDDDAEKMITVNDAIEYIRKKS